MPDLEQSLRDLFADDATRAEAAGPERVLAGVTRRTGRSRSTGRHRWAWPAVVAAAVAVLVVTTAYATRTVTGADPGITPGTGPSTTSTSAPPTTASVPPVEVVDELAGPTTQVTTYDQLRGDWEPLTLFGEPVDLSAFEKTTREISFAVPRSSRQLPTWAAGDGLNTTSGRFVLHPDGRLERRGLVASTAVGCTTITGGVCATLDNPGAVLRARSARIADATGHLLLLNGSGAVVGSYERTSG